MDFNVFHLTYVIYNTAQPVSTGGIGRYIAHPISVTVPYGSEHSHKMSVTHILSASYQFFAFGVWLLLFVYLKVCACRSYMTSFSPSCCYEDLLSFFVLISVLLCPPSHSLSLSLSLWKRSEVAVTRAIRDFMFLLTVKRRQGYTHIHMTHTRARTHTHTTRPLPSSVVTGTGQRFTLLLC